MNDQRNDVEHLNVMPKDEINRVVRKTKRKKSAVLNTNREIVDYVIIQAGIALGILAIIFGVNLVMTGTEPLEKVFTNFGFGNAVQSVATAIKGLIG